METDPVVIRLKVHEHRLPDFRRGMFAAQRFQLTFQGFEK
jgi:hypothetical protein